MKVLIRTVDVSKAAEVDSWIEDAVKEFGKLDGAANVAGLSMRHPDTTSANIVSDISFLLSRAITHDFRSKKTGTKQSQST